MNWRPPNWGNIYNDAYRSSIDVAPKFAIQAGMQGLAFEAGADAILKALWKLAEESPTKTFTLDANVVSIYRGE